MAAPRRLTPATILAGPPQSVRPFRPDDLEAVVELRRRVYRHSERRSVAALRGYTEKMFGHPGVLGRGLDSYVYESETGEVVGFQGVIERAMGFHDEPIRVAIGTQLMVAPEHRGFAGRALVRALLAGPQDLTLSDVANDTARRLWESLGAECAVAPSHSWTRTIRPCRHWANEVVQGGAGLGTRAALLALRPVLALGDRAFIRRAARLLGATVETFDAVTLADASARMFEDVAIAPRYTAEAIGWLLTQLHEKRQFGELDGGIVRLGDGDVVGWFLYYRNGGGECQVIQLAARPRMQGLVLDLLTEHAAARGGVALTGRVEPALVHDLALRRTTLRHEGAWILFHSRRPEIAEAFRCGDAYFSRLDGEWWMSF